MGDVGGLRLGSVEAAQAPTRGCRPQLAHAIRLLLEFTGTSYEEKRYTCGGGKAALGASATPRSARRVLQQSLSSCVPKVASLQSGVGLVSALL